MAKRAMSAPVSNAAKCGHGCYIDEAKVTCAKCRQPITAGEARHSFMDFMNIDSGIQNYHCRCKPR